MNTKTLSFDELESRLTPAVVLDPTGLLSVKIDTPGGVHTVVAAPGATPGQVNLTVDGTTTVFDGVTQLSLKGAKGATNVIENDTALPATIKGIGTKDVIFGGTGADTIIAGSGKERVYDLLGVNTILADNDKVDRIFTNAASLLYSDKIDPVVTFFAANRLPGANTVINENGVLYLTPPNGVNTSTTLEKTPTGDYLLITDWGQGLITQTFAKGSLTAVAYFGGNNPDVFVNNTSLTTVAYGGLGTASDTLVGGFGKLNILKGLGGSDVLVGRATENDLSNSGSSVSDGAADQLFAAGAFNILRVGPEDTAIFDSNVTNIFLP